MSLAYVAIVVFGLAMGSFASTIIHRLHTLERGIFIGRSKCPKCATTLAARDLVPLLSYLANRFKCRFCKKPIALRYPLLELSMGGTFLLTTLWVGLNDTALLVFYLAMAFVFVLLAFYDLLFQEVPDSVVLPGIGVATLGVVLGDLHSLTSLLIGFAIPVVFFGALFLGSKGRWLGGGDVRIGALMGVLLGWPNIVIGLFLGYLLGAIYSLLGMAAKKFTRKTHIPFAPFLLTGTYITLFWGEKLLNWYLSFS
ncbi:MAG: prepilin peptidase [Candidatus Peregrinibacteria bacterium]